MQRFTRVPHAFVALVLWLAMHATVMSQTCSECGGCNHFSGCPSPRPRLEIDTPTSLYWHDPCACVDTPCLLPSCPDSIAPNWYVLGELAPLYRDELNGDFPSESDFAAGARVVLGTSLGDWYRLEGSYMGSYGWDVPVTNFPNVSFSSEMDNVELNLRRRIRLPANGEHSRLRYSRHQSSTLFLNKRAEASVLLGVRYMRLDEHFANGVDMTTNNNMIGAQIGLLSQFSVRNRIWLDVEIKGGIFQNRIRLDVLSPFIASDERDRTSWVGELSVVYNHQFSRSLTFRVGYNAIAVTDVALASRNFTDNAALLAPGPVLATNDGDVVYHGPSLGLVWSH